jgi:hypothetical protein
MGPGPRRPVHSIRALPARLAKQPPVGPDWLHEIKHDGFRILARRDGAKVRLIADATGLVDETENKNPGDRMLSAENGRTEEGALDLSA